MTHIVQITIAQKLKNELKTDLFLSPTSAQWTARADADTGATAAAGAPQIAVARADPGPARL